MNYRLRERKTLGKNTVNSRGFAYYYVRFSVGGRYEAVTDYSERCVAWQQNFVVGARILRLNANDR